MNPIDAPTRYRLFKKGAYGTFYIEDVLTRRQSSLKTNATRRVSIVPNPAESCRTEIHAFSVSMGTFSSGISDSFSSFFKLGPRAFQARLAYSRFASTTNKPIPDR